MNGTNIFRWVIFPITLCGHLQHVAQCTANNDGPFSSYNRCVRINCYPPARRKTCYQWACPESWFSWPPSPSVLLPPHVTSTLYKLGQLVVGMYDFMAVFMLAIHAYIPASDILMAIMRYVTGLCTEWVGGLSDSERLYTEGSLWLPHPAHNFHNITHADFQQGGAPITSRSITNSRYTLSEPIEFNTHYFLMDKQGRKSRRFV